MAVHNITENPGPAFINHLLQHFAYDDVVTIVERSEAALKNTLKGIRGKVPLED